MERIEIRQRLFIYFKRRLDAGTSGHIPQIQIGTGLMEDFKDITDPLPGYQRNEFEAKVLDVIHKFIRNGWLHPGNSMSGSNSHLPWISVTEEGKEMLENEEAMPRDPDGYMKYLQEKVSDISPVTLQYLGESVSAYHRRHLLSATLTLGVASENEILELIDAYLEWLPDARSAKLKDKIDNRTISKKFKEFKKTFTSDLSKIPDEIASDWETYLDGIFQFIRLNRNAAGHPTGKQLEARMVYANLQVFSDYATFVHNMINFFKI